MPIFEKPHVDHDKHLCNILERGVTLEEWVKLVQSPKFICRQCGRAAAKAENLCDPIDYIRFTGY